MNLNPFFKSIIDQDPVPVVICGVDHTILYLNPAAIRAHADRGGEAMVGQSLLDCHKPESNRRIQQVVDWFRADVRHNRVYTAHRDKFNRDQYMVALRDDDGTLIGYYEKHEYRNPETAPLYDLYD